jgi:hypothetical protein
MRKSGLFAAAALCLGSLLPLSAGADADRAHARPPARVSIFATGLINPRGLKFGPDRDLYVAEGGVGGQHSTEGQCEQVEPPVGPYTGDVHGGGRISRINANGFRSTVVGDLPSSQTSPALGSLISGVADVAFIGHTLYGLFAGAGCSHGVASVPNGIFRVHADGSWNIVADLGAWQKTHPVAHPEPADFEPEGTWYSMVARHGELYALEPNHGELVRVTTDGRISRVVDISASEGHVVPTALAYRGNFYVGNLRTFPIEEGSSKVWKVTPNGRLKVVAEGLTTVLGLAFDRRGRLYALENTTGNASPTPDTGRVVRVHPSGRLEVIASGLSLPTAMTAGPDGNLYVSNLGFGAPPIGLGQVLKIEIDPDDDD